MKLKFRIKLIRKLLLIKHLSGAYMTLLLVIDIPTSIWSKGCCKPSFQSKWRQLYLLLVGAYWTYTAIIYDLSPWYHVTYDIRVGVAIVGYYVYIQVVVLPVLLQLYTVFSDHLFHLPGATQYTLDQVLFVIEQLSTL